MLNLLKHEKLAEMEKEGSNSCAHFLSTNPHIIIDILWCFSQPSMADQETNTCTDKKADEKRLLTRQLLAKKLNSHKGKFCHREREYKMDAW